jgi:hypothetical protein
MRIVVAAIFAVVGMPLILWGLGTLAAAPPITHQTFAMMQIIAGLLCFLISVVAALMRPAARAPAEAPRAAAPPTAVPSAQARDGVGMAFLIVGLAIALIVLAVQLRTPGRERGAKAGLPVPASGSVPGPVRSMTPVVTPAGKSEAGRTAVKAHAPGRARDARDNDD